MSDRKKNRISHTIGEGEIEAIGPMVRGIARLNRRKSDGHSDRHSDRHKKPPKASTEAEALAAVAVVAAFFPGKFPPETGKAYAHELRGYAPRVIQEAGQLMARELEWPSLAEWLKRCAKIKQDHAVRGLRLLPAPAGRWDELRAHIMAEVWRDYERGELEAEAMADELEARVRASVGDGGGLSGHG